MVYSSADDAVMCVYRFIRTGDYSVSLTLEVLSIYNLLMQYHTVLWF